MNTIEFVNHLRRLDINLFLEGERLRCNAPEGTLTPALKSEISSRKAEIISFLHQVNNQTNVSALRSRSPLGVIAPISRTENNTFPLSFAQQRLWFINQLQPNSASYNIPLNLHFSGQLNIAALESSLQLLINRHEILRTNFIAVEGEPVQAIAATRDFTLPVVDLRPLSASERELEYEKLASQSVMYVFNLAEEPLLRAQLVQLTPAENVLLLTVHHIIFDGWSVNIFIQELTTIYSAYVEHHTPTLPEIHLQYVDFAVWQQQWLQGEVLQSQLAYWQQKLAGMPALLELPADRPRPAVQSFRGETQVFTLEQDISEALVSLSQQQGVTLFMLLLTAFKVLLYRYTNQSDIVVGTPVANRQRSQIQGMIGFFVNNLVLRTDLSDNPTFLQLLKQVREVVLEAYEHQNLPFEKLVEALHPERNLSYTPLFQINFALEHEPEATVTLKDVTINTSEPGANQTAKLDLSLSLQKTEQGLTGAFEYSTDLFDATTIAHMIEHWQTLLAGIVENPEQRLSDLPILTAIEEHKLLVEWNQTQQDYQENLCIHQLFEALLEQTPDAVAVIFKDEQLTYQELNAKANQLAHHLQALGVKPETLVGICVERSFDMIIGLLGILKAGGAYVPIDPAYPSDRIAYMLDDSRLPVLLTQQKLVASLPEHQARVICLDADWEEISAQRELPLITGVAPENLAYVIYTSGSTGKPKGVLIAHRGLCNLAQAQIKLFDVQPNSRVLQFASLSFDASISEIVMAVCAGATLCLGTLQSLQPGQPLVRLLQEYSITHLTLVPSALAALPNEELPALQNIIVAGEPCPTSLVAQWAKGRRFFNAYGPTESTICATVAQVFEGMDVLPIGRPIDNTLVYILDRYLQPVPIGVPGELHIASIGLARGYLNRPDLTAEKFIPNPFSNEPGLSLYKTGDKARYLPDGNIEFLGRLDNQVKIRGFRIELGEVEAAIAQHPAIRETVVIARENATGDKQLVAYIVPHQEPASTNSDLRRFLKEQLPEYMVPSAFVTLESLPLTPNGKVDRRALPEPELRPELSLTFVAPRTLIEEMLANIWACVLGIEKVGVHNNFFELGGHSLLAAQVISRVRDAMSVELPLRSLFEAPTVASLAQQVENSLHSDQSIQAQPLLPIPRSGDIPLSFAQARLWFLDQLQPNSAFYNIPFALRLSGQLNVAALESSLNEIICRHEVLRTNFTTIEGQPVQVIASTLKLKLLQVDLQNLPFYERKVEAQRLATTEAQRPFDLEREPLVRAKLLQLDETEYVFLLTVHHIIFDGWSTGVFYAELAALYEAKCTGKPKVLPELPVQYADFALWQRHWLTPELLVPQLNYWKQQLLGAPALLELPTDRPRKAVQSYRGAYQSFALSLELSQALAELSKRAGVTRFMTLYAAFVTLLYRYTGSSDIVVGTPVANRNRQEIEGLIGFFVNTLALRTDLSGNPSFEQLLARVREVALGAYAHQDLPFEQLVEVLQPERSLSYTPLFSVMFALDEKSVPSMELPDLTFSSFSFETGTTKFDLTLSMEDTASGLIGGWEYNSDLFDAATIARYSEHFLSLLEGIVANPIQPISQLPLLTEAERQQLLVEWNNTWAEFPQDKCIHQLFEEQVERTPEAVAVVFEGEHLTYRELNVRANQLAHYLQTLGVGAEVLVGLCVERSFDMIIGLLGILKAGGAYVPIDPAYPTDRIAYMLDDSRLPVLLTQQKLVASLPEHQARVVGLDCDWEEISVMPELPPQSDVTPENLAYVIYTSGSTGKPKGVLIAHRGLCNLAQAQIKLFDVQPNSRVLQFASLSFDASISEIVMAVCAGATLCLGTLQSLQPGQPLVRLLQEYSITHLTLVPSALAGLPSEELPALQNIIVAGEPCPTSLVAQWAKGRRFFNAYGPTESTVCATVAQCFEGMDVLPIGRPIDNTLVYILDRYLQPVPIGVPGELHIASVSLARGYLNRSDLTAEKFIPNPFSNEPGLSLYKTGDKACYLPDGNIEFLGRIDNQVKIRGFRIELGEIETAISQYPSVKQTVVIAAENNIGNKQLVAYIVPQAEAAPTSSDLRNFLFQKLPDYMIPAAFIMLETLPLTPNGKIDKFALPKPETVYQQLATTFVPPQTSTQKTLATIWAEVLQVQEIGIHDNFFELGGDSIISIQIIARCHQANLHLTVKDLFQHQTIAELAQIVTSTTEIKAEQGLVTGIVPLTPILHWFTEQNLPEPHHFNQSFLFEISPELQPELLQQVLQQLLLHHDALRLRLIPNGDTWQLFNASTEDSEIFSTIDLSQIAPTEQVTAIETTANQLQASLNLSDGPIIRVTLFHLGNNQPNRLLIIIHHLAVDGVSWRILLEDLITAYQQLSRGETIQLPAKTTSFQDWAVRLTEYAQTQTAVAELDYWLNPLDSHIIPLPVDYSAEILENKIADTAEVSVSLSAEQTTALLKEVPQAYNTQINDVLLTALVQSFAQWTGQIFLLIDLEGHGREELFESVNLSRTVGWFTSVFPVLLKLEQPEFPGKSLKAIKEQLRCIPQRGIGYGIIRYLSEDETTRHQLQQLPQAQICFNYLGQFDQMVSEFPILGLAKESSGSPVSLKGNRSHLLDINGFVADGKLQLSWAYNTKLHTRTTIEQLANSFIEALTTIIDHCLSSPDAFGYTPTDFPDADLTQTELDELVESLAPRTLLESIYPLSPMQEGMLFHTLYAPNSGVYFEQFVFTLSGNLQVWAFEQAWRRVVELHPVLRTFFVWKNRPHPLQVVCKSVNLPWNSYDWRSLSSGEQEERLSAFLQTERERGFELDKAPLMCCTLIRVADNAYQFVWSNHHLLMDGWCLPIVLKEVWAFYEAFNQGENLYLDAPPPYRNYIAWLRQQDKEAAQKFWRSTLAGFTAPTPLGVDKLVGNLSERKDIYDERDIKLSATLTDALKSLARQNHLTLNTLVGGAWALLLSRYSGESDVVFGATVSGRPPALLGVESMVGLFINTLPVRVQISPETELLSWLKQLQVSQVEREQYSYSPLVEIQGVSEVPRNLPLFNSIVVFENYPVDSSLLEGQGSVEIKNVGGFERTNYPLTVGVVPGEELSIQISYDTSRFDDDTISRMIGHLQSLLSGIVAHPRGRVCELPLVTPLEKQQLLLEWNDTAKEYPFDKCIHQLFEEQVELTPDAVAVVFVGEQLTYRELNARANQLAHYLRSLGVGPEVLVGICVERSLEMIVGLLGILKAGGAYVPLDPAYPSERLAFMLEDCCVPVLLTFARLVESLPPHSSRVVYLDADWEEIALHSQQNPTSGVAAENLSYVMYTSGSTGKPKGVCCCHTGVVNLYADFQSKKPLSVGDRCSLWTVISFDVSVYEIFSALLAGGELYIVPDRVRSDTRTFVEWLNFHQIRSAYIPPFMLNELCFRLEQASFKFSLVRLLVGVEPIPEQLLALLSNQIPGLQIINGYGPTEATICATLYCVSGFCASNRNTPIGKPVQNTKIYLLNDQMQPVPIGAPGELYIGGDGLARGYLNRPDLTAEKFIPNPWSNEPSERLYKTGDKARYLPDGNIEFLGRIDNQVKVRGFRIELGEVETAIAQHPAIRETVVVAREDTPGNKRLVAYVVPKGEAVQETVLPTINELRSFLKTKLPDYMVPGAFVFLETMPLTPNGKIDRRTLPAPDSSLRELENNFVAPSTPTEETLAAIWAEVLGLQQVGIHDNFFELGGHSLLATSVISRIQEAFKIELPLRHLFEAPTIASLSQVIETVRQAGFIEQFSSSMTLDALPPLVPTARDTHIPLSFAQEYIWYVQQLNPDSCICNSGVPLRFKSSLTPEVVEKSINEIIRRHEILRTTFTVKEGQPMQVIAPSLTLPLKIVDLQDLPVAEREACAQRLVAEEFEHHFDLANGPLIKTTLLRLAPKEHWLLIPMHHIITDGWSIGIFLQELETLYNAFSNGLPSPLPEVPLQYADFALWERKRLNEEVLEKQLSYWLQKLADSPQPQDALPSQQLRPTTNSRQASFYSLVLPESLVASILALSRTHGVTTFAIIITALKILLFKWSGQTEILVVATTGNRSTPESERILGCFINDVILRSLLWDSQTGLTLLEQVKETVNEAINHKEVPLQKVIEAVSSKRELTLRASVTMEPPIQGLDGMSEWEFILDSPKCELWDEEIPLELYVSSPTEDSQTLEIALFYSTELFTNEIIERLFSYYQEILQKLVEYPETKVSEF